jgi:hypothetical protein
VIKLLRKARVGLKKEMKDPYMCDCVKSFVDDAVDENWPELESRVLEKVGYLYSFLCVFEFFLAPLLEFNPYTLIMIIYLYLKE